MAIPLYLLCQVLIRKDAGYFGLVLVEQMLLINV